MRKVLLPLLASLAVASPALANESRIEARGGVIWDQGHSEGTAGIAAGYDFDIGSSTFAGVEVSGDKILESNTRVAFGATARAGAKIGDAGKAYVSGGYTSKFAKYGDDSLHLGAGYQHNFGSKLYGKVEYRHYFFDHGVSDPDAVAVGLGVRF